jgi:5-methylcytosine-specific restriction endonuclease McrA
MAVKRDWTAARKKLHDELVCRMCNRYGVEAAHIIPRSRIRTGGEDPRNIVPLCRACHTKFDAGEIEILPALRREEQVYAVELVGLGEAWRRLTTRAKAAA